MSAMVSTTQTASGSDFPAPSLRDWQPERPDNASPAVDPSQSLAELHRGWSSL